MHLFTRRGWTIDCRLRAILGGAHVLLRPGEVGLPAMLGVGPSVTLSIEKGIDRYTQVQSMEENEIGLLLKPCNVHVGLFVKFDVMFTFLACFPAFFSVVYCLRIIPASADSVCLLVIHSGYTLIVGVDGQQ